MDGGAGKAEKALTGQMRASRIWQMNELNGLFFGDREDGSCGDSGGAGAGAKGVEIVAGRGLL